MLQDYGDSGLRKIVRQARRLIAVDQLLKQYLPENLKAHCQIAQITATELTILADSAAWLTHLRYLKPQLLQQLKKHPQCAYLQDLQLRIQPTAQQPEKKPENMPTITSLSLENKELLRSMAESINHPQLKKTLIKLSD